MSDPLHVDYWIEGEVVGADQVRGRHRAHFDSYEEFLNWCTEVHNLPAPRPDEKFLAYAHRVGILVLATPFPGTMEIQLPAPDPASDEDWKLEAAAVGAERTQLHRKMEDSTRRLRELAIAGQRLGMDQPTIAGYLGVSKQHVNQIHKDAREAGLID
jgi:DNA-binding XRE family transcriptional regulator